MGCPRAGQANQRPLRSFQYADKNGQKKDLMLFYNYTCYLAIVVLFDAGLTFKDDISFPASFKLNLPKMNC
jgi:hypothetical protein